MIKRVLLIAVMIIMGLTGCSGQGADGKSADEEEERMKITIAVWDADEAFAGDAVLDEIEERFCVEFEPVTMKWEDYYQRIERWAATGSLPDLFVGDFRNSMLYTQWVRQGLLHAIPKDLSAYPNLERYLEHMEEARISFVDGNLYCIPRRTYPSQEWTSIDRIIAYRWDLAQAAGIEKEPENWEEFQEMILAIIREDPENTGIQGLTAVDADMLSGILLPYASSIAVSDGNGFYWKKDRDGMYRPVYFTDDLICAFQLARDMYTSGVIEKDVVMQTTNSAQEKFLRGESAAILYSGGYGGGYGKMGVYWKDRHENDFTQDVKALKLMPDVNGNKTYPIWGYAWSESYINAKADSAKVDKILQIYDYLLTDEGAFFAAYGPEGDLYEIEDGRVKLFDQDTYVADKYPSCAVFSMLVRWHPSTYDERFPANIPEIYDRVNHELAKEAKEIPIPEYETECIRIMKEKQIDFSIRVGDDFLRIMTGTEPVEQMWEEIEKEYEEKGLQEMIDTVNAEMKK